MNLYLIGHSVVDEIIHKDGSKQNELKPGGLWHSVNGILPLLQLDDNLWPVTMISEGSRPIFGKNYAHALSDYIKITDDVPKVTLTLHSNQERKEEYTNLQKKLQIDAIPFEKADGIFINMITGFDITAGDLHTIRAFCKCYIYMDIHSLTRSVDASLGRPLQKIKHIEQWLKNLDVVQVNQAECGMLFDDDNELTIAAKVINCGVSVFIVTKGNLGAKVYYPLKGEIVSVFKKALSVSAITEVGCGDVFGSVFFYTYIKTHSIEESLEQALISAGKFVGGHYP